MLSVDFGRLGLRPGDRLLDLGCGGGRHAFEAARRGAQVVALDMAGGELKDVAAMVAALYEAGELPEGARALCVQADALRLPFPDESFDRVIAAEVLEHIEADAQAMTELSRVLRKGGTAAVTVPRFWPELVNWALSDEYHATPGGHVRIYRRSVLSERLARAGLRARAAHHAHALHSPYWWLRCLVGVRREDHPLVRAYHRLLVWDITKRPFPTRLAERLLDPVLGKSLVVYVEKVR